MGDQYPGDDRRRRRGYRVTVGCPYRARTGNPRAAATHRARPSPVGYRYDPRDRPPRSRPASRRSSRSGSTSAAPTTPSSTPSAARARRPLPLPGGRARRRAQEDRLPSSTSRCPSTSPSSPLGGHVHPGGLWVDLRSTRGQRTKEVFRSEARYYEPAGAVSWDASMTFTKPDWRVAVHKGDTLSVSATDYDPRARRGTR